MQAGRQPSHEASYADGRDVVPLFASISRAGNDSTHLNYIKHDDVLT